MIFIKNVQVKLRNNFLVILLALISLVFLFSIPFDVAYPVHDEVFQIKSMITLNNEINNYLKFQPLPEGKFLQLSMSSYLITIFTGAAISKLYFSFMTLRLLAVFFTAFSSIIIYFLLKEVGIDKKLAFLGALVFVANPLVFVSAHKIMSEAPSMLLLLLSLLFFVKAVKTDNNRFLLLGSVFSILMFYERQIGLVLPATMFLYFILFKRKQLDIKKISILAIPFAFAIAYFSWVYLSYGRFLNIFSPADVPVSILAPQLGFSPLESVKHAFFDIIYAGLFVFPFALLFARDVLRRKNKVEFLLLTTAIVVAALFAFFIRPFPVMGYDTLESYGTLILPQSIRIPLTFLSLISGVFVFYIIFTKFAASLKKKKAGIENIIFILFGIYFIFTLLKIGVFPDRYLIVFVPLVIILICKRFDFKPDLNKIAFVSTIVLLGTYSWVLTYNYFNYHSAVWDSVEYLILEKGVVPADIEGNMEVNVYFFNSWKNENAKYVITNDYLIRAWKQDLSEYKLMKEVLYPAVPVPGKIYIYESVS